ncbi:membrane-spanning 4-domains subfamily A member 8-like [Paroedura picta]|uniref:membrane-spanning 4-domains subfamily A member 8-like n=1 Tax=Paroedura picta TaxID=143630 RepID=UPI0040566757
MAADQLRMANGSMLFIPPNSANVIQAGQLLPGTVIQSEGVIQYVGQQPGNTNSQPEQSPQQRVQDKLRKVETKTLGAIQIIIGLMHIGFGGVSAVLVGLYYIPLAIVGLYPFWGGIFFIASGSLSVSAENPMGASLVKCSVGMNITSAVMALIGMILYIAELAINSLYSFHLYLSGAVGFGLGVMLFLFSLLEFCITVWTAHFGCQATCYKSEMAMIVVPCTISGNGAAPDEADPVPPSYNDEAFSPK